jgi:photosystem II stability/assembly factor-like uncharacterized protein
MCLKFFSTLWLSFSLFSPLAAQWTLINPFPTNNNLTDMMFPDPEHGIAVGLNGTLLTTSDAGDSWKVIPTGFLTHLNSVASPDSVNIFICGDNGLILKTDIGCTQIDTITSGEYVSLNKLVFLNHETGFCLGNDRWVYKTGDGGEHWTGMQTAYTGDLRDVSFVDDSVGFLIGYFYTPFSSYSTNLFHTRDQGASWVFVDSLADIVDFKAICFTDSLTGFLAGYTVWRTTDGGKSWGSTDITNNILYDVFFQDKQNGWAINYDGYLIHTTDGGDSWNSVYRTGTGNHIMSPGGDILLTYGTGGDIWKSADGGDSWKQVVDGVRNRLPVIHFVDPDTGYILGDSVLYRTTDSGATWKMEHHPAGNIDDAAFAGENRCLALAWNGPWLSTDGCRNWHKITVSLPRAVFGCAFADDQTAWITGVEYGHFFSYSVILKSTDGGETWGTDSLPGKPIIREMYFMPDGTGFALGFSGGLYKTGDAGRSWEQITGTPDRFAYRKVYFPSKSIGYAIGVYTNLQAAPYNTICKSVDSGSTWTTVYQDDVMFSPELSGVYFVNDTLGYVTGSDGFILKTKDGGATWTKDFSTNYLYEIDGTGNGIWAVGYYGTILAGKADTGSGIPDVPLQVNLIRSISPNPFHSKATIGLTLDRESTLRIRLTDLTGRQVRDLIRIFPMGESTWILDDIDLAPGVYVLTISTGNKTSAARMVKIGGE